MFAPIATSDPRPDPLACLATPLATGSVADGFLSSCKAGPGRQALVAADITLTYEELNRVSRDLAERLLMLASPGARVGIYARRSPGFVVAMLAATRAGMTFAVLDAAYPLKRIRQMAELFHPDVMIGSGADLGEWRTTFPDLSDERCLSIDQRGQCHGSGGGTISAEASAHVDCHAADTAYLLFTSGTTGTPKCIATGHAPLIHFVSWYRETFKPTDEDRFSLLSGLGHDPVLRDIFVPLSMGAEVRIPEQGTLIDPDRLVGWLDEQQITFMHATPPLLKLVCAGAEKRRASLAVTHAFSGGDALPPALARNFLRVAPNAKIVNFYGTTETPQAVAYHVFSEGADTDAVPVGAGIRDTQLLIVSERGDLADIDEPGQIAVRSRFLSQGYLEQESGSPKTFVASPFSGRADDTIYLTGDYGYYRADGQVVLQYRGDDQVKIRGYRVELAEVNRAIEAVPDVRGAVTLTRRNAAGEAMLVAFVAVDDTNDPSHSHRVLDALADRLPAYMVPARFLWLRSLPLLPNGKIHRSALVASLEAADAVQTATIAGPDTNSDLARQWRAILGVSVLRPDQSFVEMGGDSLSYVQAGQLLERHLGFVPDGWDRMPFRELSRVEPRAASGRRQVGGTILIRAISILAIVLHHFGLVNLGEATPALFVIAGWSFAKFQMRRTLDSGSVRPILRSAWKILLPTALAAAYQNWVLGQLRQNWFALLGISNYFPVWMGGPQGGPAIAGFWFVDVLLQIFVLLAILFACRRMRAAYATHPFRFAMLATLATIVGGAGLRLIWDTRYMNNWVPHFSLWMVFLGMAMQHAGTRGRQLAVMAVAALALASGRFGPFSFICVAFATFVERVRVPAVASTIVTAIAASSLYIYITHQSVHEAIHRITTTLPVFVEFCGVVCIGVLIQLVWNRGLAGLATPLRLTKTVLSRAITG